MVRESGWERELGIWLGGKLYVAQDTNTRGILDKYNCCGVLVCDQFINSSIAFAIQDFLAQHTLDNSTVTPISLPITTSSPSFRTLSPHFNS